VTGHHASIVGLDVGTSAVKVVVAEPGSDGKPRVIGVGTAEAAGIRRGVVVHMDAASASIAQALAEAELTSGLSLTAVNVALSGAHLRSVNSRGIVGLGGSARPITREDTSRAIESARPLALEGREILDAFPQEFVVDGQDGVSDPVGIAGTRLEVNLHVVTGSQASLLNLFECVNYGGAQVTGTVLAHQATAEAVLSDDERDLGVALVDIGAGTTSLAIFERGTLCHTAVIAMGGSQVTYDLAVGLRTPLADAERLKRRYARTFSISIDDAETIEVPSMGNLGPRAIPRRIFTDTVALRTHTLVERIADEICSSGGTERLTAGVVLTGGGGALRGLPETMETILGVPVRRACPAIEGSLADMVNAGQFATAAGVALWAARNDRHTAGRGTRGERLRSLLRCLH
jgi:cell division protein FtsA